MSPEIWSTVCAAHVQPRTDTTCDARTKLHAGNAGRQGMRARSRKPPCCVGAHWGEGGEAEGLQYLGCAPSTTATAHAAARCIRSLEGMVD